MGELVRSILVYVFLASFPGLTACSFVLDSSTEQCSSDADCAHFEGHPFCRDHVCVFSGLGPDDCSMAKPTTDEGFANHCTTAMTRAFDNCGRLGLCNDSSLSGAMSTARAPIPVGMLPPGGVVQTAPTVRCVDALGASNIIYVTGSTNLPPLLKAVQPLLDAQTPPRTVVFAPQTSCKGVAAIYDASPGKHKIFNTTNNWAFYYRGGTQTFCLLDDAGNDVDVGESDVYPASCNYPKMTGIADYAGPIQAITFVVPLNSTQTVISAEAAHLVFGAGGNSNQTAPWINPSLYFIRSEGTGTVQLPSRAIGVNPAQWWGIDLLSAANLVGSMKVVDPDSVESTIGILSSDFADRNRAYLRVLAFQQHGQHHGYFPDSTPDSFDKANVRDGHYPIWGAIHFMAPLGISNTPSEAASALITQFLPPLNDSLVAAIIDAGFVPQCAMKVTHDSEVGPLMASEPKFSCSCFFDKKVTGTTTCQTCSTASDCPAATAACNYGFCEKKPAE
jgi:hypothetical protein